MIRKDLGKDAVILSTKRITTKKWLGLWRNKRLEVLAAAGEDMPIRTSPPRRSNYGAGAYAAAETAARELGGPGETTATPSNDPVPPALSAQPAPIQQPIAVEMPPVQVNHNQTVQPELVQLQSDLSEVKRLLQASLLDDRVNQTPFLKQLASHGVETSNLLSMLQGPDQAFDVAGDEQLVSQLKSHFLSVCEPQPIAATTRIAAFVGPTGVGKTTTIAKIAALQMLSGHRRVGMLTTDTYRIAAVEQLRTYARILDIPLEVVYQPNEFEAAIERLSSCDLILIDTAGRNYRHGSNVEEMRSLLSRLPVDETHLVLSLTSKPEDLERLAEAFMALPVDKFLFTKLDETTTFGAVFNLLHRFRKPLSYLTNGQSVPDDIEVASLEKLLQLMNGGAA